MERWLERSLWTVVVLLAFALLVGDPAPQPAYANDAAGKQAAIATAGSFFVVDTDNQWIGLYGQPGLAGPRLISAQNYQYAMILAGMTADSENTGSENASGWTVPQVRAALK